jgi:hypothetical protein
LFELVGRHDSKLAFFTVLVEPCRMRSCLTRAVFLIGLSPI